MTVSQLARRRAPGVLVRAVDSLEDRYEDALAWVLDRPRVGALIGGLLLILLFGLVSGASAPGPSPASVTVPAPKPIRITVTGPDEATLAGVARRAADEVRHVRGVVDVTSERAGTGRTLVEASVYARGTRDVMKEVRATLADLPLPPGFELDATRNEPGSPARGRFAVLAGLVVAIATGGMRTLAGARIASRRRARGDPPRVAAVVAARRRFAPNLVVSALLLIAMILLAVSGNATLAAFGLAGAASLVMVDLAILFVLPVAQSIRPVAAR